MVILLTHYARTNLNPFIRVRIKLEIDHGVRIGDLDYFWRICWRKSSVWILNDGDLYIDEFVFRSHKLPFFRGWLDR